MKGLGALVFMLCLIGNTASLADELGRLFFSSEQRAALDQARRRAREPAVDPTPDVSIPQLPFASEFDSERERQDPISVNGYVKRSNGAQTVWINGLDSWQGNLGELGIDPNKVRLEASQVRLPLGPEPSGVLLKPGQSFDPNSNEVRDDYERGPEMLLDVDGGSAARP